MKCKSKTLLMGYQKDSNSIRNKLKLFIGTIKRLKSLIFDNNSGEQKFMLKEQIHQFYGHKIRVRVCGILIKNGKILLLKHNGIGEKGFFWNTPGGEPENNENFKEALEREFKEETGLKVTVGKLIHLNQFIDNPLHAIEYYFEAFAEKTNAVLGNDPENIDILSDIKWFTKSEFDELPFDVKPQFLMTHF